MMDPGQDARMSLCPSETVLASYADGSLGRWRKGLFEFHLARCQNCRLAVAYAVKAQRESELPMPPAELIRRATRLGGLSLYPNRWKWVTAGTLAGVALLVAVQMGLLRQREHLVTVPPGPAASMTAKSEPVAVPGSKATVDEVVRGKPIPPPALTIVLPHQNGIIATGTPQFKWNPLTTSQRYEVQVVRLDGEPVWQGITDESMLQIPSRASLKDGTYFVWITASLESGQLAKSSPVRFQVKR